MRTTVNSDKLRSLFQAFRERNEVAFERAADSIISEELAANHHTNATVLKQALGEPREQMNGLAQSTPELRPLPKDRRNGEDLLWVHESTVTPDRVTFAKETGERITRVLEEHRSRKRLREFGYRPKTKLLFWGPPGTGKTLTAFYLAHELGLPLGVLRLNTVISSFLGDTAAHLQRIFTRVNNTPMVLLLDEVDALGKNRDDPNDVGELKRVVNSLLQAMDAFDNTDSVLVAASNHQYLLDPALWRRFDDVIQFPLPGLEERKRYLRFLLNGVTLEGSVPQLASKMEKLSFADIEHVTVEAVKSMILQNREALLSRDVLHELTAWRKSVQSAKRRNGATA